METGGGGRKGFTACLNMTQPKQKRCQAPGCGQPISAERLRRHPSAVTCPKDCQKAHRRAQTSRAARAQRARDRQAEEAQENGWQGISCDYSVRLPCSQALKDLFDASIPKGHTAASWLREILVTLMRTKEGLGMWALNELVAIGPQLEDEREADLGPGRQALYSDIPSSLWESIRQRAGKEGFNKAAPWLRRVVFTAVRTTEHWTPKTPAQQFKLAYVAFRVAGRKDPFFLRVANALMKRHYAEDFNQRSSRWGVSPADLRGHPLLRDDRASVPTHVLLDNLNSIVLSLYHERKRSEDLELLFVAAILDQCDPRVGWAVLR